jgi:hypothetical protein
VQQRFAQDAYMLIVYFLVRYTTSVYCLSIFYRCVWFIAAINFFFYLISLGGVEAPYEGPIPDPGGSHSLLS